MPLRFRSTLVPALAVAMALLFAACGSAPQPVAERRPAPSPPTTGASGGAAPGSGLASGSAGPTAGGAPTPAPGPCGVAATPPATPPGAAVTKVVPILMYHHIADPPKGSSLPDLYVSPTVFEAQLRMLKANGWTSITAAQLGAAMQAGTPLPAKSVVLSFDDGRTDNLTTAFPLLERYGFRATFYIPAGLTTGNGRIGFRDLAILARAGEEIGNHTMTHIDLSLPSVTASTLATQIGAAGKLLMRDVAASGALICVRTFAYPSGRTSSQSVSLLRRLGYTLAVTTVYGRTRIGATNPLLAPRLRVWRGETAAGLLYEMTHAPTH